MREKLGARIENDLEVIISLVSDEMRKIEKKRIYPMQIKIIWDHTVKRHLKI